MHCRTPLELDLLTGLCRLLCTPEPRKADRSDSVAAAVELFRTGAR